MVMASPVKSLVIGIAAGYLALRAWADTPSRNQDILNAIQEMQKAKYFTFIMLLNMSPADLLKGNITFLMPRDERLSQSSIQNVTDFLMRHSIPSPMLFNHLSYIPTDSVIPSMHPTYALRVSNYGKTSFFLNNARLTSPNLCTLGMSVRCHGIDDVLSLNSATSAALCLNDHNSSSSLQSPAISPNPPPEVDNLTAPAVGPEPAPGPDDHLVFSKTPGREHWMADISITVVALHILLVLFVVN